MDKIGKYKEEIIEALNNIARYTFYNNKAGRFDINKDAEEFYRGLLNLFYSWDLKNANTEKTPNYTGVDLLFLGDKVAVQVTSENDSVKVHKSIEGFKNKALKEGYTELYILMFKDKQDFPRADFEKTVDNKFTFDKDKHIIDHSNLLTKLRDAKFDYVEAIWKYLFKWECISIYSNLDENEDLGIIGDIFDFILSNIQNNYSNFSNDSDIFTKLKIKVPINFPDEQRNRLSDMIKNTTSKRLLVQKFLENIEEESRIQDLKEFIQTQYCEIRGTVNHETPIDSIDFINQLSEIILPLKKRSDIHYQSNAKAIILHFFEICDFGKKTQDEIVQQKSLFD